MDIHKQPIHVRVRALNESTLERASRMDDKLINFRDSSDRKWLMNSLMWALNHNVTVTLSAESN